MKNIATTHVRHYHVRTWLRPILQLAILSLLFIAPLPPTQAQSGLSVTTTTDAIQDDGTCSLREAIINANSDTALSTAPGECVAGSADIVDVIDLAAVSGTLTLQQPLPDITTDVRLEGSPTSPLTLSPDPTAIPFAMLTITDTSVTLRGLTFSNGHAVAGAALFISGGSVSVEDVIFTNNTADSSGGAIFNDGGDLIITDSVFTNNTAGSSGGAIFSDGPPDTTRLTLVNTILSQNEAISSGGAVYINAGDLTLTGSTFSNNTATSSGGALFTVAGLADLRNVTFSANSAGSAGGGIYAAAGDIQANNLTIAFNTASFGGGIHATNAAFRFSNSLIAANSGGDCDGDLIAVASNLVQSTAGCNLTGDLGGVVSGLEPLLAPLADYGGPTPAHALLEGSPAVDSGSPGAFSDPDACEFTDQRGTFRPIGLACDLGAFESVFEPLSPPVVPVDPPVAGTVVRGLVFASDDTPLSNVRVSALHDDTIIPVRTHDDGSYSLTLNNGGVLTINYEKTGFMPVQRQVNALWQDYTWTEDVVLLPFDTRVNSVDLTSSDPIQVVQGNPVSDNDGTRQATLLIPQGTTAELLLPDGSTQPIDSLSIRATEYTVGDTGPQAMPGNLPANVGYTYAVEYSADEAMAVGATRVQFSQPVYHYVENFLNFPVGMIVPMGYYDREQGLWIPSDNGQVVEILEIANGLAEVDTDGDGAVDNGLGLIEAERMQLAALYSVGQSLWRVPITHFTPWDCNWPWWPPLDARGPGDSPPPPLPPDENPDDPDSKCGSVIECQSQTLGERVPLVGTGFNLNYRSDRVLGRQGAYAINIPLSDNAPPESLKRIDLEIVIAGRRFLEEFQAEPNQSMMFTWDRHDAYGRTIAGKVPVRIRLGYVYDPVYAVPSSPQFGLIAGRSFGGNGVAPITNSRARQEVTIWRETWTELGALDNRELGLGGWSLDVHHTYRSNGKTLYMGNGQRRSVDSLNFDIIDRFAGGNSFITLGDGGPALAAGFRSPNHFAVGPDGSVYVSDSGHHRIRRIWPDGIITTVAGSGVQGYGGDGGPATEAQFRQIRGIAVGPDGSVYITDTADNRIRRVGPEGIITTFAGNGEVCDDYATSGCGEGGPANQARLNVPVDVAVGPDGSVYIASSLTNRVDRVSPDGIITRFAGTGARGFSGDGGLALNARMFTVEGVAVGPDGSVYIVDNFNRRIRRVSSNGIISTFVGNGGLCSLMAEVVCGDGGPASEATLSAPAGIKFGPDGSLYIADVARVRRVSTNGIITTVAGTGARSHGGDSGPATQARINDVEDVGVGVDGSLYFFGNYGIHAGVRRVTASLPGLTTGSYSIASEDGAQVYGFDPSGRHLETRNAYTGAVIYSFGYDSAGLLSSIADGDGNITSVERDGSGNPTAIVGPFGQRTALTLDANGFLSSVTNPAGEAFQMEYTLGGLLTEFTNPRGYTTAFTYDADGYLTRHDDPAGGFMLLSRSQLEDDYSVDLTTGLGRTTIYEVENSPTRDQNRTNTLPNGLQTSYDKEIDGTRSRIAADGSSTSQVLGPDPRFGMLSPVDTQATLTTPGGLIATTSETRTATLADPNDLFSLETLVEQINLNGRTYTRSYDNPTRTFNTTTPEGRTVVTTTNDQGRPLSEQVAGLAPVTYTYDMRGRIETATQAGRTLTFSYNDAGYVETIIDPIGRVTSFVYDAAGRVIEETLPGDRVITYDYDANGNLISLTPPGQPAHTFNYTAVDQIASYTPPDVGTGSTQTVYAYDIDRDLNLTTRSDGRSLDFDYDSAGRLDALTISRGVFTYSYSPTTGNLSAITAPDGVNLTFAYDGFLLTQEAWSGPVTGSVSRSYDNDFRLTSISINGANPITLTYDDDSLLTGAGDLTLARDAQNGLLTGTTLGNVTDAYGYNNFGEMTSYNAANGGTDLYTVDYTRDDLGRITALSETIGSVTTTYGYDYDVAGRLHEVQVNGLVTQTYSYDDNGNRLSLIDSSGTTTGTYDAQDRLLNYGGNSYTYNANGDLTTKTNGGQTTAYAYDELGNLMQVVLPDGRTIDYVIDGTNRRVGKSIDGVPVRGFLWEDDLRISAEVDDANNLVSRFVYADSINVPAYMIRDGVTYRLLTNHLGSVRLVVSLVDGSIIQRMDYDSFGRVTLDTNPGFQPFGFAGGLYDADTGLVRFGARDYDAEVGRWTTKDPIGFAADDTNLYVYVGNDSVNFVDPTGKWLGVIIGIVRGAWVGSQARSVSAGIRAATPWIRGGVFSGIAFTPSSTGDGNTPPPPPSPDPDAPGEPQTCEPGDPDDDGDEDNSSSNGGGNSCRYPIRIWRGTELSIVCP